MFVVGALTNEVIGVDEPRYVIAISFAMHQTIRAGRGRLDEGMDTYV